MSSLRAGVIHSSDNSKSQQPRKCDAADSSRLFFETRSSCGSGVSASGVPTRPHEYPASASPLPMEVVPSVPRAAQGHLHGSSALTQAPVSLQPISSRDSSANALDVVPPKSAQIPVSAAPQSIAPLLGTSMNPGPL